MREHKLVTLHPDILTISFKERTAIKKAAKDILGIYNIDHMALDIVDPDGIMTFLSSTPTTGFNVCSTNLWEYDGSISPTYYQNHAFYWWDDAYHEDYIEKIKQLKEYRHGFTKGFMLVRKINNFYILYSFGTKSKDPLIKQQIQSSLDEYLKIGDYIFNELRIVYQNYVGQYSVPKIRQFIPFSEGKPVELADIFFAQPQMKLLINNVSNSLDNSEKSILSKMHINESPKLYVISNQNFTSFIRAQ